MKLPSIGGVLGIAALGGIGYVIYKFYTGAWALPSLGGFLGGVVNPPGDPAVTIQETGVPGATGDIIYNLFSGNEDSLRQRATEDVNIYYHETKVIEDIVTPPGETPKPPDEGGVFARSVAATTSQDIHDRGLLESLLLSPITIGAGLGAVSQQERWYKTLSPAGETEARKHEAARRITFRSTPEGMTATAISSIFPPLALFNIVSQATDIQRASTPTPKPKRKAPAIQPTPKAATGEFIRARNVKRSLGLITERARGR